MSRAPNSVTARGDIQEAVTQAREFVRTSIEPVLACEPRLRIKPEEYVHKVKNPGEHTVSLGELLPLIQETLAKADGISLYAHMPVCPYHCSFCHYPTLIESQGNKPADYVELLLRESDNYLRRLPEAGSQPVTSLYLGGGTPTLMCDEDLFRLMNHFRSNFQITLDSEISTEGTPETFTDEKIAALREAGINRINVGVQVLDNETLKECGREHSAEQGLEAVRKVVAAGFKKVNVDLIYGLPDRTVEQFATDVDRAASLRPTSITLYRLRLQRGDEFPKTQMLHVYQAHPEQFPSSLDCYAMQVAGRLILLKHGYEEQPSGWFCLPGGTAEVYEDRWFHQRPLVAFGWWTYSYARDYEYRNTKDRVRYKSQVEAGELPISECFRFSEEERHKRYLAYQLKSRFAVDRSDFERRFGKPLSSISVWKAHSSAAEAAGIGYTLGSSFTLEDTGKVLVEEIIDRLL